MSKLLASLALLGAAVFLTPSTPAQAAPDGVRNGKQVEINMSAHRRWRHRHHRHVVRYHWRPRYGYYAPRYYAPRYRSVYYGGYPSYGGYPYHGGYAYAPHYRSYGPAISVGFPGFSFGFW